MEKDMQTRGLLYTRFNDSAGVIYLQGAHSINDNASKHYMQEGYSTYNNTRFVNIIIIS